MDPKTTLMELLLHGLVQLFVYVFISKSTVISLKLVNSYLFKVRNATQVFNKMFTRA